MDRGVWQVTVHGVAKSQTWLSDLAHTCILVGFLGDSMLKNLTASAQDAGLTEESGRSPGEGNGNPNQCFCLGNPMDTGAWQPTQSMWLQESNATQRLNNNNVYLPYQNLMGNANTKPTIDKYTHKRKSNANTTCMYVFPRNTWGREEKKTFKNKPKTIKIMAIGTYILITTFNVNGINAPNKRQRLAEWT